MLERKAAVDWLINDGCYALICATKLCVDIENMDLGNHKSVPVSLSIFMIMHWDSQ